LLVVSARSAGAAEEAFAPPSDDAPAEKPTIAGFETRVGGFIQADAILSNQHSQDELDASTGAPLNQTRFLIRRARIRLDVERRFVWGSVELDANTVDGIEGGLTEADVGTNWRGVLADEESSFRTTLGLFRIPFGMEVPERDPARFFLERTTMSRAFFPGSIDLGARAEGAWGPLRFALAAMNGNPIADRFLPARDPNAAKDIVGRLGVESGLTRGVQFRLGFSALDGTGLHAGTPSTKDVLVWRDNNENGVVELSELENISGAAATASQNFHRFALGCDVRLSVDVPTLGALTVSGELVVAKNLDRGIEPADPVSLGRDVREFGYYLGLTQELTRVAMVGIRYDRYQPDFDAIEQRGVSVVPRDGTYSTWAFAAALRWAPGRLILEYDVNGNALGRTRSGIPTTLADNQLALRGEVLF
jgi:hypothetical protein